MLGGGGSGPFGNMSSSNAQTTGTPAASGSLFGSTAPAPASGTTSSIFGSTASGSLFGTPAPAAGASGATGAAANTTTPKEGGLFVSTSSNAAPSGGGLLGSGAGMPSSSAGGLLGGNAATGTGSGNSATSGSAGSLFGSTAAPAGNAQNASQGSLFGGSAGAASGLPDGTKPGLFGVAGVTAKPNETAKPGLFGGLSTTGTTVEAPKGGLFGGTSTAATASGKQDSSSGGLFGSSVPAGSTSGSGTSGAPKGTGLFGSLGDASKTASGGGLFGSAPGAAGGASAGTDGKGSGLFGTPTTVSGASQQLQTAGQTGTAGGSSLFGFGASGSSGNVGGLSSVPAKAPAETKDGQKGSEEAAAPSSAAQQSTNGGQSQSLPGASSTPSPNAAGATGSLFGAKSGSSETNTAPAAGTTARCTPVLPPEEVALETMQHERMDDLLTNWERRLQRKVGQFDELAQEVAAVEASLITQSRALASIREEQQRVHRRQLFVGETIDMIEQQQNDLTNLLASIESSLLAKLSPQEQRSVCSTVEQSMSQRVLDIDVQMDELSSAIAQAARRTQPDPVAAISQVLAVHQAALETATQQCTKLEQCLKSLQRFVA
ncbi:Spm1 (Nucleoporin) protein, related [Eimeria brunetti]|uniref:Spm1 (Nucleoporin) protein, related n=1 Tax=Eimeria brunetti TaxID=51314 RepID=U6LGL2_9EIME|nr:Spm1 (Nucleoporin) protein, related [Eimeria brunetti]